MLCVLPEVTRCLLFKAVRPVETEGRMDSTGASDAPVLVRRRLSVRGSVARLRLQTPLERRSHRTLSGSRRGSVHCKYGSCEAFDM